MRDLLTDNFRAFSARIGADPLLIQGPGGNTSIKDDAVMWIKASGKELADAVTAEIFVAVDRKAAEAEARGAGDGTCKATVLDPENRLRPSIETTFHAVLDWRVVAHTHSVAVLAHVTSPEGREVAREKLADLEPVFVPYVKPGRPLTGAILDRITPRDPADPARKPRADRLRRNHRRDRSADAARRGPAAPRPPPRLRRPRPPPTRCPASTGPAKRTGWRATMRRAGADHRRVLLPRPCRLSRSPPAHRRQRQRPARDPGARRRHPGADRRDGRPNARCCAACRTCCAGCPDDWALEPIGADAEAALLNWDAEKYRQSLAKKG